MKDQWEWLKYDSTVVIDTWTSLRLGMCSWRYMLHNQRFNVVNCPWYTYKQHLHINPPRPFKKYVNKDSADCYKVYVQSFYIKETEFSKSVLLLTKLIYFHIQSELIHSLTWFMVYYFHIHLIESWCISQHLWPQYQDTKIQINSKSQTCSDSWNRQ